MTLYEKLSLSLQKAGIPLGSVPELLGELREAKVGFGDDGRPRIEGRVYCDNGGRFMDGQRLLVGPILSQPAEDLAVTAGGTYLVQWKNS